MSKKTHNYHSKLKSKHTSLKKYTNWAKLSHVTQDLEFTSWPTSCELYCPDIYTVCDTVSARFACIILPEFHTEFFKKINHTNALQENERSAAAWHTQWAQKIYETNLSFLLQDQANEVFELRFFWSTSMFIQIFQKKIRLGGLIGKAAQ